MENFKAFESKLDEYLNNLDGEKLSNVESNQGYGLALIACNKYFNGRFLRSLITAKKKIVDAIQQKQSFLKDNEIGTLKHYFKYITADNSALLNEGALILYLGLADLIKRQQNKYSSDSQNEDESQFMKILRGVIKSLKPLLLFYFINRQCNKRINSISCYLIKSYSKISSQKRITLEETQKNKKNNQQQNQNEHLLLQIQEEFSNYSISQLIDRYLKEEENKIIDSTQICRMCEQKIKLKDLQFHIKNCSKKTKIEAELKTLEEKSKQLYQEVLQFEKKIMFKQNECQKRQLHVLKILKMMKQAYLGSKRVALRRNTQLNNVKKQPIQDIKRQLELFQQNYQKDELLCNLVKNKEDIVLSRRKLALIQINTITKISSSKGSDIGSFKSLQSSINNAFGGNGFKTKKSLFASKNSNQVGSKRSNQKDKKCSRSKLKSRSGSGSQSQSSSQSESKSKSKSESSRSSISIKTQQNLDDDKQNSEKNSIKHLMCSSLNSSKFKQIKIFTNRCSRKQIPQKNSKSLKNVYHFEETEEKQKMGLNQFEILKFLGKGAFGKVYLVRRKTTRDIYALKHIIIQNSENKIQMQLIKNQHQIFEQIAGNHLIRAPFAFTQQFGHFFVLQFMPGGDLSQILAQQVYLEQDHAKFYLAQIILALEHLHNCNIIHRDLKPQNIVIDKNGHIKLTDFGLSEIKIQDKIVKVKEKFDVNRRMTRERANRRVALVSRTDAAKVIGTPDYIAPQIINQTSINNTSIDWWSLGVMAYQMIVGCRPFSALSVNQVLANIVQGKIQWPQVGREEGMMSPEAYDLISKLLDKNFQRRLGSNSIQQIKSHKFFEGIDWANIKNQKPPMVPKNQLASMKQYSKLTQDQGLRIQITQIHNISMKNSKKGIGLQNFVRYDFLLQQTYESVEQRINKQKTKFERIKTIGSFIEDEEQKQNYTNEFKEEEIVENSTENKMAVPFSPQPKCRKISARKSKNVCFNIA